MSTSSQHQPTTIIALTMGAVAMFAVACCLMSCVTGQNSEQTQNTVEESTCRAARAATIIACATEPEGKACADAKIAEQAACVLVCPQGQAPPIEPTTPPAIEVK